ncbi:MAG: phosphotransferase family protein, partial [Marmoricola sp.]|nr:phosphotransferase family protein [Marmoricola sp.]
MSDLPGMDVPALTGYLAAHDLLPAGDLAVSPISGGRSNLTYEVTAPGTRWVLRRPPTAGLTASAHDMVREWTVMSGLQGTAVPVARTIALCEDEAVLGAPFTIVEFVEGGVIRTQDDLASVDDDTLARIVEELVGTLVALHGVDIDEVGLGSFGRPDGFVQRQVALWWRQWGSVRTRDLPDVERLHRALASSIPVSRRAAVLHGDFRVDNTILAPGPFERVAAVVDWELSALGDPLTDVALMCAYRHPAFDAILGESAAWTSPRLPDAQALASTYADAARRDLPHWPFYQALAYFKLAVIGEGIAHRAAQGF